LAVEQMTLVQKLAAIRSMVEVIRKNKSSYTGKYVSEDKIMAKVAAGMKKYHVVLHPSVVPGTMTVTPVSYTKTKRSKSGDPIVEEINEVLVTGEMLYTWINTDNPDDKICVHWYMVGQQGDASQAFGSALTYTNRYFLLKFFQIATPENDPDAWRSDKAEAEAEENRMIADEILEKVDAHVKAFLESTNNSDAARKKLISVVKKIVRDDNDKPSADYASYVADPDVAAELLESLKKNCPITSGGDNKGGT